MIGEGIELFGVLRSRSTRSRRLKAENHQELPAGFGEAVEHLVAIASKSGARAAPDGPIGPVRCASSARRNGGRRRCLPPRFELSWVHTRSDALLRLLGAP